MKHSLIAFAILCAVTALAADSEIREPAWGFGFAAPAAWKCQHDARGAILGHDTIAGMILVLPHTKVTLAAVTAQLKDGLTEQGATLSLKGELKALGTQAMAGDYSGTLNGLAVKARGIGTCSTNGGGAFIIALTTPEKFGKELIDAAETLAKSVQYPKQDGAAAAQYFVGAWGSISQNGSTKATLNANGTYVYGSESAYSGQFKDSGGNQTGAWGVAGQNSNRGTWIARGSREQGVLEFTSSAGEKSTFDYKVHVENGKTYWNEYYIGGKLYAR